MAPGVDTLIGTFIAVAVTVALWILRGLRQDVRAVATQQAKQAATLNTLHLNIVQGYVPLHRYEEDQKAFTRRLDEDRRLNGMRFDQVTAQLTDIKVTLAQRTKASRNG